MIQKPKELQTLFLRVPYFTYIFTEAPTLEAHVDSLGGDPGLRLLPAKALPCWHRTCRQRDPKCP